MYTGPKSFARYRVSVSSKCIMGLFWAMSLFLMTTATATKTSVKNLRRAASNFIALNISSRSVRQILAIISGVDFVKTVWFVQLETNKFQGLFKDKSQFSRTNIYSVINRHSLTPFWTHHWLKHVMYVILFKHKNVLTLPVSYIRFLHRGWDRFSSAK